MEISQAFANLSKKLEGIKGLTATGRYTAYPDNIGVWTLGYGHALVDAQGHHIKTGEANVAARCTAAIQALGYGAATLSMDQVLELKRKDFSAFAARVSPLLRANTSQNQFDALVDFAYNVGSEGFAGSTLLRMHQAGAAAGTTNLSVIAANSRAKGGIGNIGAAFAAWSNADHQWSLGVFHRRMLEFLIYTGMDYDQAYSTAFAFRG